MKILHGSSWYLPDTSGGVEVYIEELVKNLRDLGISSTVAAARKTTEPDNYTYNGTDVYRYPCNPETASIAEYQEQIPPKDFEYFADWINRQKADIYHQHSWRFGCGVQHLRLAHRLGLPSIVTIHLSEAVCLRGTMMRNGETVCDGRIDETLCGRCVGVPPRVPDWAIGALSNLPAQSSSLETYLLNSPEVRLRQLGRAIGIPGRVKAHRHKLLEMAALADRIIAVCEWLYEALLINGVPEKKVVLCRQGVASNIGGELLKIEKRVSPIEKPLRVGFLGRWHETKGAEVLVEAVRRLPGDVNIELTLHGMVHGESDRLARDRALAISQTDSRIRVAEKLSRLEVTPALMNFDVLAVPSQCLETGPLVVLEAFKLGVPVLGSDIGGIAELVRHGVNGLLVPALDVQAWADALADLARNRLMVVGLGENIHHIPVRTMEDVAAEMAAIYREVVSRQQGN
ncbi:glycosyltransferase [Ancylothrix sp. C2]|uniref:glycosyltransferase n=1 Tax=Ancylothrix sp. D3o TaxID=2953691 RepID=UPI0021BB8267|nr:glycosyltransferase [Ancylothrix sp. D3o]MCT7948193.1 glycosyltransferase [Ancylothrix sp. D3o]